MKYQHHHIQYEIEDEWLAESGAKNFQPLRKSYRAKPSNREVFLVTIASVEPVTERAESIGIFCDDKENGLSAKQRVIRILRWFVSDAEVEPIEVVPSESASFKFKLVAGCHRFHCAHALGFKMVPATIGFDISAPYA